MVVAFWSAAAALLHTYVGFPLLVGARARLAARPYRAAPVTPSITVVMAARNEAHGIGAKLDALLACDYPPDCRQIVVASDGSTDGTDEIVAGRHQHGVELVSLRRVGKAAALNAAVARATGDIVVFTDANSLFERNALRALVAPFADPEVGGVAGDQRYLPADATTGLDAVSSNGGERRYWDFDRAMKRAESRAGNVISGTGAIYAVRRHLVEPVAEGVTDDFATSTAVVVQHQRLVFRDDAVAWEPVAASTGAEFERKVRVMTRGLRAVALRRELLDPRRHGFYSYQLLTHKVLRRLMAVPLAVMAVTAPFLWRRSPLYRVAAVSQSALYAAGALGTIAPRTRLARHPVCALPAFFCMVNVAGATAAWNVMTGHRIERWEPRRPTDGPRPASPPAADEPLAVLGAGR